MHMWEFWSGMGPTRGSPGEEAFQAFLNSLEDDEDAYSETEMFDVSPFRKAVLGIDRLLQPGGSEPRPTNSSNDSAYQKNGVALVAATP